MANENPDFLKLIEAQLLDLTEQQQSIEHSAVTVELDQSRVGRLSRMDALQSQAMHKETLRRLHRQVAELHKAKSRLANDEFGDCEECAEPIAVARLSLNPAATLCIACAERAEIASDTSRG